MPSIIYNVGVIITAANIVDAVIIIEAAVCSISIIVIVYTTTIGAATATAAATLMVILPMVMACGCRCYYCVTVSCNSISTYI